MNRLFVSYYLHRYEDKKKKILIRLFYSPFSFFQPLLFSLARHIHSYTKIVIKVLKDKKMLTVVMPSGHS